MLSARATLKEGRGNGGICLELFSNRGKLKTVDKGWSALSRPIKKPEVNISRATMAAAANRRVCLLPDDAGDEESSSSCKFDKP